jgi:hypothetical protein
MLSFLLNNLPLALNNDTSIRITWHNTACYFESIPGDTGLGIDVPYNDINRTYLGNPDRFQTLANDGDKEFPNFEIRYDGFMLLRGTLVIHTANRNQYSGWLRSDIGNLGKIHREKYIYDIDAFNQDVTFENKANYVPGTDDYGCPKIFNPEFFYDKGNKVTMQRKVENPDYVDLSWWQDIFNEQKPAFIDEDYETEALTEAFRTTANWFVNDLNPDNTVKAIADSSSTRSTQTTLECTVVSPMLFLNYIVKTILKDANIFIDNNFIESDADLSKLILYSNFDITNVEFEVKTVDWSAFVFDMHHPTYAWYKPVERIIRNYNAPFKYKNLIPKVNLADFILSIQNELNLFFHFKNNNKVDILDREAIFHSAAFDINKFLVETWEMGEKKNVTLKFTFEHDKNDTFFSDRWEDVDDRRIDEKAAVDDWPDLESLTPELGELRFLKNHNLYVEYTWIQETAENTLTGNEMQYDALGWKHFAVGFQNGYHAFGRDNEEEVKSKFSTLFGEQTVFTHQRGNTNSLKFAYQSFSPRLLLYHGNNLASFESQTLSLDWEKINTGLMAKRYPAWSKFWASRQPVITRANFPINALAHTIENIPSKFRCNEGEFIIKKMETNFGLNKIGTTKIEAFKI